MEAIVTYSLEFVNKVIYSHNIPKCSVLLVSGRLLHNGDHRAYTFAANDIWLQM